jgi:hypothetical protein
MEKTFPNSTLEYTPLAVVSHARKTLRVSTTATIAQIPELSSKEGAVIGAALYSARLYACQLYTYSCLLYALSNRQPIKKCLMFLPGYGPNHCAMPSIGQTWVLASIGAVVEMGILSTLKRLLMESTLEWHLYRNI